MAAPSSAAQPGTPSGPNPSASKSEYDAGEKVLCFHGPLIYEAKVLKTIWMEEPSIVSGLTGWHYFVHYKGWKQTYVHPLPHERGSVPLSNTLSCLLDGTNGFQLRAL